MELKEFCEQYFSVALILGGRIGLGTLSEIFDPEFH